MTDVVKHLTDLWDIPELKRDDGIKVLSRLYGNILNNPSEPKYHDLNFIKICKKFDECQPCIDLLFVAGFTKSSDGTRLEWKYNGINMKLLYNANDALKVKITTTGNNNNNIYDEDDEAIITQLLSLGIADNKNQIQIAMKNVTNRKDINEITEYITNKQDEEQQIELKYEYENTENTLKYPPKYQSSSNNQNKSKNNSSTVSQSQSKQIKFTNMSTDKIDIDDSDILLLYTHYQLTDDQKEGYSAANHNKPVSNNNIIMNNNKLLMEMQKNIMIKSRQLLQAMKTNSDSQGTVTDALKLVAASAALAAAVPEPGEPAIALFAASLALIVTVMEICDANEEQKWENQHLVTLMSITLTDMNLSEVQEKLQTLIDLIMVKTTNMINVNKRNADWQQKSSIVNVRACWIETCQTIYDEYNRWNADIGGKLKACIDQMNFEETDNKMIAVIVNQIFNTIHLIYFRYMVYSQIACLFADGPTDDDKILNNLPTNHFITKTETLKLLDASTKRLIQKFKPLCNGTLKNDAILKLFNSNTNSATFIQCLNHFDSSFIFTKSSLLNLITVRNQLDTKIKDVKIFFVNGNKWQGSDYAINTAAIYAFDWKTIDIHKRINTLNETYREASLGGIESKQQKSINNGFAAKYDYRCYWDVQFTTNNHRYKITKNNAQCNVWKSDHEKEVEITILRDEKGYIRVNFMLTSGTAYFYCKQLTGKFQDEPNKVGDLNMELSVLIESLPKNKLGPLLPNKNIKQTKAGSSKVIQRQKHESKLNAIIVRNKLDTNINDVKIFFVNGNKWQGSNNLIKTAAIYASDWKSVDIHKRINILNETYQEASLGGIESKQQKSTDGFTANCNYRCYWDVQFTINNHRYKINKNNAQCNVWKSDHEKDAEITILRDEKGYIRVNFMLTSGTAYFSCEHLNNNK